MGKLKRDNSKKCVSILREFIDDSSSPDTQKQRAILALNQLQKIAAGTSNPGPNCIGVPRAD